MEGLGTEWLVTVVIVEGGAFLTQRFAALTATHAETVAEGAWVAVRAANR